MPIYAISNNVLSEIPVKDFALESEIQNLFETNLKVLMGLTLVKHEFSIKDKRIDTLAFDEQSRAFVIIEYKRNQNISVFDQGITVPEADARKQGRFHTRVQRTAEGNP